MRLAGKSRRFHRNQALERFDLRIPIPPRIGLIRQASCQRHHQRMQGDGERPAQVRHGRRVHREVRKHRRAVARLVQQRVRSYWRMLRYENRSGKGIREEVQPVLVQPKNPGIVLFVSTEPQAENVVLPFGTFVRFEDPLPERKQKRLARLLHPHQINTMVHEIPVSQ